MVINAFSWLRRMNELGEWAFKKKQPSGVKAAVISGFGGGRRDAEFVHFQAQWGVEPLKCVPWLSGGNQSPARAVEAQLVSALPATRKKWREAIYRPQYSLRKWTDVCVERNRCWATHTSERIRPHCIGTCSRSACPSSVKLHAATTYKRCGFIRETTLVWKHNRMGQTGKKKVTQ